MLPNSKGIFDHRIFFLAALRVEGTRYDRTARNPLFAHAELSVASELLPLSRHYHPSVAIFASNLLNVGSFDRLYIYLMKRTAAKKR